jgi:superfamily II DNA or RNA helicase
MRDRASLDLFAPRAPPALTAAGLALRPYQTECLAAIDAHFSAHRSGLAVLATGLGKTVIAAAMARKRGGCMFLAHRDSLIKQAAQKLEKETGEKVAIEKAERTAFASPYICASVQTLKGPRLDRFAARHNIEFIVIDEAHRSTAKSYRNILDAFPFAQVLGITATADRSDDVALGEVFEPGPVNGAVFRYEMPDAMTDGWLTPLKVVPITCSASLDGIKIRGGDFDAQQLEDALEAYAGETARSLLDQCGDHRLIVFRPGVKSAHATAGALNLLRPGCAWAIDGTMDDATKEDLQERHKAGEYQYLVNCSVLTEGYDDERLSGIFDGAPTKSRLRAVQKWGRATRIWPDGIGHLTTADERRAAIAASPKPWAMLYDLTMNSTRHEPVSPADDLLAGRASDEEIKRVKEKLKKAGGDVASALADVRAEIAADRAAAAAKAALIAANRRSKAGVARTIWDMMGVKQPSLALDEIHNPDLFASGRQIGWLRGHGVSNIPPHLSKKQASKMIGSLLKREKLGLATPGQVEQLQRLGVTATNISKLHAIQVIATKTKERADAILPPRRMHPSPEDFGD